MTALIKKVCFIILVFISIKINAQLSLGSYNTPYAGVHGLRVNPAEIVDSRYKFHMNLFGLNLNVNNDYLGVSKKMFEELRQGQSNMKDSNRREYLIENLNGKAKSGYAYIEIPTFSFMYNINHKHSIGLSTGIKSVHSFSNVSEILARFSYDSKDTNTWKPNSSQDLAINSTTWTYVGFTYGREIFNKKGKFLKAAVTLKANFGLMSAYFRSDNLYLDILDRDNYSTANGTMTSQFGTPFYGRDGKFQAPSFGLSNMGFGADLGFIYEKRDGKDYTYEMDCRTDNLRNDLNKYKYRIGVSIIDFGTVPFQPAVALNSFTFDSSKFNGGRFKTIDKPFKQYDFIDSLRALSGFADTNGLIIDTTIKKYSVWTPTTVNAFIDYRIWKGFYIAANTTFGFVINNETGSKINNTSFGLVPRWEGKVVGLYFPLGYSMLSQEFNAGFGMRLFFLNFGIQDLMGIAGLKQVSRNAGFHFSINVPIVNKGVPKDKDKDLISDKLDKCKDVPGNCDNMGCAEPDQDEDGVPDKEDKCPTLKGPLETAGCPDKDKDGIIDREDKCPNEAGLKEYYGCPDTDGDGVSDNYDKCPKEVGSKLLDGCPDRDKDGVPDYIDKCPDTVGLIGNEGCPEEVKDLDGDGIPDDEDDCPQQYGIKANRGCPAEDVEKKIAKLAQENLEFLTGSAVIKKSSFASLNMVAQILKSNPDLKLKLEGHTDNVGKLEKNMKLSLDRAISVKTFMQSKGIEGKRIEAEGFGPTKPKSDNASEAGRAINRRVEIEIIR